MTEEIKEIKKNISAIKKQVYSNKEEIIVIKVENKNFKDDINRLINKLDNFIDVTTNKEMTKNEKLRETLRTVMYGSISTLVIYVLLDYMIR